MNNITSINDSFGRTHDYLRISLTERCNLRCTYCMPAEGVPLRERSVFMSPEEVIQIAQTFVDLGIKKIRLTGGEPLVKKGADKIIEALGKLPVELTLTTNAILVDQFIDSFKSAGIHSVNVSLDSLQSERFSSLTRRDYFDRVMKNIQLLLKEEFQVKINVVLMRGENDDEILDFVKWSTLENISIRFIEFMPFDGNAWNFDKKVGLEEILSKVKGHFGDEQVTPIQGGKNDTTKHFKIKGAKGTFGVISTVTNPFCDTCNRIRLTADGKIKNCLFSKEESDLLGAFREGKDLTPIIQKAILKKEKMLGGYNKFNDEVVQKMDNRSMITIGG